MAQRRGMHAGGQREREWDQGELEGPGGEARQQAMGGDGRRRPNGDEGRHPCFEQKKNREGEEEGWFGNFQKLQGLNLKVNFPSDLELKWKSAQHESCSIFQDLQLSCYANFF